MLKEFFVGKRAAVREFKRTFAIDNDESIVALTSAFIGSASGITPAMSVFFRFAVNILLRRINVVPRVEETPDHSDRRGLLFITTNHVVFFSPEIEGRGMIFFRLDAILGVKFSKKPEPPRVIFYVKSGEITRWWLPKHKFLPTSQEVGLPNHRTVKWLVNKLMGVRKVEIWGLLP